MFSDQSVAVDANSGNNTVGALHIGASAPVQLLEFGSDGQALRCGAAALPKAETQGELEALLRVEAPQHFVNIMQTEV